MAEEAPKPDDVKVEAAETVAEPAPKVAETVSEPATEEKTVEVGKSEESKDEKPEILTAEPVAVQTDGAAAAEPVEDAAKSEPEILAVEAPSSKGEETVAEEKAVAVEKTDEEKPAAAEVSFCNPFEISIIVLT